MSSSIIEGFPVDINPAYEGQRIRKPDMYVEFGGPKVTHKFELVRVKPPEEVEDGVVNIVGPDLPELEEGGSYPLGILIYVAGAKLSEDVEGVIERRIHMFTNYIEGVMHLNQRYDIWVRIAKKSVKKGLNTLKWWGKALIYLFKSELPFIEKMQVTFITDLEKIVPHYEEALEIYEERDARVAGLKDEEVDMFYGCVLCQSFAPTHVCIITPERISLCGSVTWLDAKASAEIDPKGPNFPVPKGELLDPVKGEWSGVNEVVAQRSLNTNKRVYLYSMFEYPHTSCGCFECIAFYIPEVDGIGIVHRDYRGEAVNGLPFSKMAEQTGGGIQTEGFLGIGIAWMRSRKFLQADGGWSKIVWMPASLKERVKDAIPSDMFDKIATENDAKNVDELREFLIEHEHPLAEKLKAVPVTTPAKSERKEREVLVEARPAAKAAPTAITGLPLAGAEFVLKGVKIRVERIIIKKKAS